MTTQTLYEPNKTRTPGDVQKTRLFTDRLRKSDEHIAEVEREIADIREGLAPAIVTARTERDVAAATQKDLLKKQDQTSASISTIDTEIAYLLAEVAKKEEERKALFKTLDQQSVEIADATECLKKTETGLVQATKNQEKAAEQKVNYLATLKKGRDKDEYRLNQHLARHPMATLDPPPPVAVLAPETPSEDAKAVSMLRRVSAG